jgi:hypothetical protein
MSNATERRVRVALWLTHLYSAEADDVQSAWPQRDGWAAAHAALCAAADAMYAHAKTLAGGELPEGAWQRAVARWGATPAPAPERITERP